MRFSELLLAVADVQGIRRVRFTTSHPNDFTPDIGGSNRAAAEDLRPRTLAGAVGFDQSAACDAATYSREEYLEKIAVMRGANRPIAITTDIIVGFPGETESDFEETISLLEEVSTPVCSRSSIRRGRIRRRSRWTMRFPKRRRPAACRRPGEAARDSGGREMRRWPGKR